MAIRILTVRSNPGPIDYKTRTVPIVPTSLSQTKVLLAIALSSLLSWVFGNFVTFCPDPSARLALVSGDAFGISKPIQEPVECLQGRKRKGRC